MSYKNCVDCGQQIQATRSTTVRCQSCFFKSRARADSANQRMKKAILKSRGKKCQSCGASGGKLYLHHIVSVNNGGANEPGNIKVVCHACHLKEHPKGW